MLDQIPLKLDQEGIKERKAGKRGGEEGDYSREAIVFNISIKGGDYSREVINRGTAIIQGNTVPFLLKKMGIAKGLDLRAEPSHIKLC